MSGFQGLTLLLQERHGELVDDVGMLLVGHVAAVLDDMQLGVVHTRERGPARLRAAPPDRRDPTPAGSALLRAPPAHIDGDEAARLRFGKPRLRRQRSAQNGSIPADRSLVSRMFAALMIRA
jgi:hypothetical protein